MQTSQPRQYRQWRFAQTMAALAACVVLLTWAAAAEACPMCKTALGSGADAHINAWGASIVFMLSMPFLLVGSFSLYMYVLVRRARAEQLAQQAVSVPESAREAALVE
ncbi:MAG TPA: hypothetical protein VMV10_11335 [Pirellulales bacterium]|nr:hypothetical protein [Pirellulales bacterium]